MRENNILSYPCIFTNEKNEYWGQFVEPLDGIFSRGNTLAECIEDSREALGLYLETVESYPEIILDFKKLKLEDNQIVSYVSINMKEYLEKYSNKSVKKTLSIPAWLNVKAEKANINFSQILQRALMAELNIDKN